MRPLALHFVFPPELAQLSIELVDGLVIGREGAAADAPSSARHGVVPHGTISRRHATVRRVLGVPLLSDLGSSNGTRINGQRITEASHLTAQMLVRFGDVIAVVDEYWAAHPPAGQLSSVPGRSPRMLRARQTLEQVAADDAPLLVLGETGTGKEWVASEAHRLSGRSGPYLALNCAELSPQLMESQLFGHERGAFTGATATHAGLFAAADKGTLFLDEVGEIPGDLQAKLLRVLQDGQVRPVGSVTTRQTDVRVVCATNRDLPKLVDAGQFRRDLYARLSFFEIQLPPLRERRQDILFWVEHFCERWRRERAQQKSLVLQPAAVESVLLHPWPDNLRGIDRLVHRLLASESGSIGTRSLVRVMPDLFRESNAGEAPERPTGKTRTAGSAEALERPTREEFLAVYEATGRSVRATSKHFGRDRRQVYRWLESFGIPR